MKKTTKKTQHDARLDILVQRRDALAAGRAESCKGQPATWHSYLAGDVLRWSRNLLGLEDVSSTSRICNASLLSPSTGRCRGLTDESVLLVTKSYSWWDSKMKQLRSHTPQCLSSSKRWDGRSQLSAHRLAQSDSTLFHLANQLPNKRSIPSGTWIADFFLCFFSRRIDWLRGWKGLSSAPLARWWMPCRSFDGQWLWRRHRRSAFRFGKG